VEIVLSGGMMKRYLPPQCCSTTQLKKRSELKMKKISKFACFVTVISILTASVGNTAMAAAESTDVYCTIDMPRPEGILCAFVYADPDEPSIPGVYTYHYGPRTTVQSSSNNNINFSASVMTAITNIIKTLLSSGLFSALS
jgi:hypothetical protein